MHYEADTYYHVYNRGAHSESIFPEPENYRYLTSLLEKYSVRYRTVVAAYCLMPNHYHLILRQEEAGSIGMFLRTVFNAYTQAVNKRFGTSGTLFEAQAKVKQIFTEAHCLRVIPYVHLNPVTAALVASPGEWEFSNYLEWTGQRNSILMDRQLRDNYFPSPEDYARYTADYQLEKERQQIGEFMFD